LNPAEVVFLAPIRSTSAKFRGFLMAHSKTPSKTLAIFI
jgi:hypothetical protein